MIHIRIASVGYMVKEGTVNHIISECGKLVQKEYKTRHRLGGKGYALGNVQKIKIWSY